MTDKKASTAARALLDYVFLEYGFPVVLQSDRGGEWMNAELQHLTKLLSIEHVFTTSYRQDSIVAQREFTGSLIQQLEFIVTSTKRDGKIFYSLLFMLTTLPQLQELVV